MNTSRTTSSLATVMLLAASMSSPSTASTSPSFRMMRPAKTGRETALSSTAWNLLSSAQANGELSSNALMVAKQLEAFARIIRRGA